MFCNHNYVACFTTCKQRVLQYTELYHKGPRERPEVKFIPTCYFSQPKNVAIKEAQVYTRALKEFIRIWRAQDKKRTDMYTEKCLLMEVNGDGKSWKVMKKGQRNRTRGL
jgi:hypothetical protein